MEEAGAKMHQPSPFLVVRDFFHEMLIQDADSQVLTGALYRAYVWWAGKVGVQPLTMFNFKFALRKRGLKYRRTGQGQAYIGFCLRGSSLVSAFLRQRCRWQNSLSEKSSDLYAALTAFCELQQLTPPPREISD